jgi:membrane protease YdiL (CAAX protease family)
MPPVPVQIPPIIDRGVHVTPTDDVLLGSMAALLDLPEIGAIALDGLAVLVAAFALLGVQLSGNGSVLNDAVRRVLDALPAPLRVHKRFEAAHWGMVSNLWKYALILALAVVVAGVDLAWLNLATVDPVFALGGGLLLGAIVYPIGEVTAIVASALGYGYDAEMREMLAPDSTRGWVGFLGVSLVVVSCWEELLFRAVFVGVAAHTLGVSPWITGALAVAGFGAIHQYAPGNVIVAGAMGGALTVAFVLGASLPLLVVAHTTANALEFIVYESELADDLPTGRLGFAA